MLFLQRLIFSCLPNGVKDAWNFTLCQVSYIILQQNVNNSILGGIFFAQNHTGTNISSYFADSIIKLNLFHL